MEAVLRIALGVLITGHGIAHGVASLVARGFDQGEFARPAWMPVWLQRASFLLWAGAAGLLIAAGVGLFVDAAWLSPILLSGAVVSFAVLALWWATIPIGGKLGLAFDIVLIAGSIATGQ